MLRLHVWLILKPLFGVVSLCLVPVAAGLLALWVLIYLYPRVGALLFKLVL